MSRKRKTKDEMLRSSEEHVNSVTVDDVGR